MRLRDLADRFHRYAADPRGLARAWRGLRDRGIVARSPLFDRVWYLREHPDVAASGVDPALHYLVAGHPAGLDPGPGFCGAEYAALNGLSPEANPLVHYERTGRRSGARISFLQPGLADGRADPAWRFPTPEEHQAAFPAKVAAIRAKADAFVTGEMSYHEFFGHEQQLQICVIGHYESEQFTTEILRDIIVKEYPELPVTIAETCTNPILYP